MRVGLAVTLLTVTTLIAAPSIAQESVRRQILDRDGQPQQDDPWEPQSPQGKTEETYLNEIIAFMQEIQFEIRNLRYRQENGEETYELFRSECLGGLR